MSSPSRPSALPPPLLPATLTTSSTATATPNPLITTNHTCAHSFPRNPGHPTCGISGVPHVLSNPDDDEDPHYDALTSCCTPSGIGMSGSYSNCVLYCILNRSDDDDKSMAELKTCWKDAGTKESEIECDAMSNGTKTASSSVGGATGNATSGGVPSATGSKGAAPAVVPRGASKAGLGVLGVVLGSVVLDAML